MGEEEEEEEEEMVEEGKTIMKMNEYSSNMTSRKGVKDI